MRRHIAIVIYIPNADKTKRSAIPRRGQLHIVRQIGSRFFQFVRRVTLIVDCRDKNLALLGIGSKLAGPNDSRFWSGDYGSRSNVALIGAAEDEQASLSSGHARRAGCNEPIVNGVYGDADDEQEAGTRALNDALRRHVAVGIAIENQDAAAAGIPNDNFVVLLIDGDGVRPDHLGVRSLDDANGRFRAIGAAAEHQHGIGERDGNYDFVMRSIVGDAMHRSAQARSLAGDDPYGI